MTLLPGYRARRLVSAMRERLLRAFADPAVVALLRGAEVSFELAGEDWHLVAQVTGGVISESALPPQFVLEASNDRWAMLASALPVATEHSLITLVRSGVIALTGDELAWAQHCHVVRALVEAARPVERESCWHPSRALAARGEYVRVTYSGGSADVYVERCGSGPAVLALATAGSDTSQWHGLMTDSDFTDHFELITVDLPWHGKSSPLFGKSVASWSLSPAEYTDFIVAVADALALENPVLLGVSMAGGAVVHAVATHGHRFAGAVACQAGERVVNRAATELRATNVNQTTFVPEWTYGLINPASPEAFRRRVWWGYSSGGYGLYAADIASYLQWDFAEVSDLLSESSPHIAVLSGRFDTSVPPAASRALAEAIPNSSFVEMPELGHFPHAENPAVFANYARDALARVLVSS